jgi:ribosomal protein S3
MRGLQEVVGDGMVWKVECVNQGDLAVERDPPGVRVLIVALKPGNAGGAKGDRKVES